MSVTENRGAVDGLRAVEPESWAHHVVDMDGGRGVSTSVGERPFSLTDRARALKTVVGGRSALQPDGAVAAEPARQLSARQTFQAAPLSFLEAFGRSWSLSADANRLEWFEFGGPGARAAQLRLWFRDVVVNSLVLVSLDLRVGSLGQGVTGSYEVRSSAAPPRLITVTGVRDDTVDVVVRPNDPFAVLVTAEPGVGMGYFALRNACYLPL